MLKKIEYRINYRSTREMDLIFRKFWSYFKNNHTKNDLIILNKLINEDDLEIYNWITGVIEPPKNYGIIIKKIRSKIKFNLK